MLKKNSSLIKAAVAIQTGLEELESHGVDVDHIVGVSGLLGNSKKTLVGILSEAIKLGGSHEAFETAMTSAKAKSLPPKPRSRIK